MENEGDRVKYLQHRALVVLIAVAAVAAACSSDPTSVATSTPKPSIATHTIAATFHVRPSIDQVTVTGADKGAHLALFDRDGVERQRGTADELGAYVFREVSEGPGYRVQQVGDDPAPTSAAVRVMSLTNSLPPQSLYSGQQLDAGFHYITTRDGTTLSAAVYLPGPADQGPYPTVVEYSGYSPSNPTNSLADSKDLKSAGIDAAALCPQLPFLCKTPDQPASLLASAMGYAVVAVNMRGTGCSGGSYDFFEPLQLTDGYDIVETVAAQPWVKHGKVGLVGLSYPGISQLFVGSTQPPHLAAIAPLSVLDDSVRGTLAPGGIFNTGFALAWAKGVLDDAKPYGQSWTKTIAAQGDTICADNQKLRLQNVDTVAKAKAHTTYPGKIADPLNPDLFVSKINVPTFLACAFEDEQTGGRCARLTGRFTNAPVVRYTYYNGAHSDAFAPQVLVEWKAFLDIYVAGAVTPISPLIRQFGPTLMQQIFGVSVPFPPDRWTGYPDFASAKKAFEAEQPVRVIFESGAGAATGAPVGRYEARYPSYPPPGVKPTSWYLQPNGRLAPDKPDAGGGASRFVVDPALGSKVTLPGDSETQAFDALPPYQWDADKPGDAAAFLTDPLTENQTLVGTANADLWIRSSTTEADLGVTLTEVRPDGKETFVQSGTLRASLRALAGDATELDPNHGAYAKDQKPLVPGQWTEAQVEIFPFAHVFRAGSRLRISIHTPGGDRPRWSWILAGVPDGSTVDVAHDAAHPSRLVLPVASAVPGTPAGLPPCPGRRGQPCRTYVPYTNVGAPS